MIRRIKIELVDTLPQLADRLATDGFSYAAYPGIVFVKQCGIIQGIYAVEAQASKNPSALLPTCVLLQHALDDLAGRPKSSAESLSVKVNLVKRLIRINAKDQVVYPAELLVNFER